MTDIRRYATSGRPVFMTVVCARRRPCLQREADKELLLAVLREMKNQRPFIMLGYVILDDHFHWLIRLPERLSGNPPAADTLTYDLGHDNRCDHLMTTPAIPKPATTLSTTNHRRSGCDRRTLPDTTGTGDKYAISEIMQSVKLRYTHRYKKRYNIRGQATLWQRRFWDHIVRDQDDLNRHLDYIHVNPVKHGYAKRPLDYPFSSMRNYVERGVYPPDWAGDSLAVPETAGRHYA